MNYQKLFWGILLLLIGILMLLNHLGLFHIHFWILIHFWPVILILWGIIILPIKTNIKVLISIVLVIVAFITIAYISEKKPEFFKSKTGIYFRHHNNSDEEWDDPYYDVDSNTTDI